MKRFASILLGLCTAMAMAQLYPSKLGLLGSAALRLSDLRIRTELQLSEDQGSSIVKLIGEHAEQQQAISKQLATAKPEQYASFQAKLDKAEAATAKSILGVLTVGQRDRLLQLAIQDAGLFALRTADIAKKVGLTPEQRTKVQAITVNTITITDEIGAKMAEQLQAVPAGKAGEAKRNKIVKTFEPRVKQTEAKGEAQILALLSKAQVEKWKSLKGKSFKL